MELVIATNNKGKLRDLETLLPGMRLLTLEDIGFSTPIPEPYETFTANAMTKAMTVYNFSRRMVMADDSGLCVDALGGRPGVYSARYAGEGATDEENLQKLLSEMEGQANRKAYYTAVICVVVDNRPYFFEGTCHGTITERPMGSAGFGYDPVFLPDGYRQTFAQLPQEVKNSLSHRGEAVRKMVQFFDEMKEITG